MNVCNNCTVRSSTCHIHCGKYIIAAELHKRKALRKNKAKAISNQLDSTLIEAAEKVSRKHKKKA